MVLAERCREVAEVLRAAGVEVRTEAGALPGLVAADAETLVERYDFRRSPCVDYGRLEEKVPRLWVRPVGRGQLAACLRALRDAGVPFKVRGGGHSSGGQALIDEGAVVDMSGLAAVLADDPAGETITVEGGCHWLAVAEALHGQGRRPRVLTDNPRTTVAGTLAVGGFGDSSHRDGLQAAQVVRLEVLTLDGACHAVGPGDPLFDYTLCGRGQLAVIASATLATQRCPTKLLGRIVRWNSLARFLADAEVACRAGYFDYFRARYRWAGEGPPYYAVVGCLDPAGQAAMQRWEFPGFAPDKVSGPSSTDLMNHLRVDHFQKLQHAAPALEVLFPLAGAAAAIERFVARVREAGLAPWLAHGSSLMVCRCDRRLPLAPFPAGELCALFAMRPRMPEQAASALLPAVRALGRQTLEEGAKLYLMSVDPDGLAPGEFLDRAFGSDQHLALAALKARWDPGRLLNPWVL